MDYRSDLIKKFVLNELKQTGDVVKVIIPNIDIGKHKVQSINCKIRHVKNIVLFKRLIQLAYYMQLIKQNASKIKKLEAGVDKQDSNIVASIEYRYQLDLELNEILALFSKEEVEFVLRDNLISLIVSVIGEEENKFSRFVDNEVELAFKEIVEGVKNKFNKIKLIQVINCFTNNYLSTQENDVYWHYIYRCNNSLANNIELTDYIDDIKLGSNGAVVKKHIRRNLLEREIIMCMLEDLQKKGANSVDVKVGDKNKNKDNSIHQEKIFLNDICSCLYFDNGICKSVKSKLNGLKCCGEKLCCEYQIEDNSVSRKINYVYKPQKMSYKDNQPRKINESELPFVEHAETVRNWYRCCYNRGYCANMYCEFYNCNCVGHWHCWNYTGDGLTGYWRKGNV